MYFLRIQGICFLLNAELDSEYDDINIFNPQKMHIRNCSMVTTIFKFNINNYSLHSILTIVIIYQRCAEVGKRVSACHDIANVGP